MKRNCMHSQVSVAHLYDTSIVAARSKYRSTTHKRQARAWTTPTVRASEKHCIGHPTTDYRAQPECPHPRRDAATSGPSSFAKGAKQVAGVLNESLVKLTAAGEEQQLCTHGSIHCARPSRNLIQPFVVVTAVQAKKARTASPVVLKDASETKGSTLRHRFAWRRNQMSVIVHAPCAAGKLNQAAAAASCNAVITVCVAAA